MNTTTRSQTPARAPVSIRQPARVTTRTRSRNAIALAIGVLFVVAGVHAGVQANERAPDRLSGTVAEVFGNDVILDVDGQRVLVRQLETVPTVGQAVTVRGTRIDNTLTDARLVEPRGERRGRNADETREAPALRGQPDERRAERADTPQVTANMDLAHPPHWGVWSAPWERQDASPVPESARQTLGALGLDPVTHVEPRKRHVRGYTTDARGLPREVRFEFDGSLREVRLPSPLRKEIRDRARYQALPPQALVRAVEAKGFRDVRVVEFKRRHAEMIGRTADGRQMRLDVAADGTVLRARVQPEGWWGG